MITKKQWLTGVMAITAGAVLVSGAPLAEAKDNHKGDQGQKSDVRHFNDWPVLNLFGQGGLAVKEAEVTGIAGTTLNAKATWNNQVIPLIVTTDGNTKVTVNGNAGTLANITVGSKIAIRGTLTLWGASPTVYANQIILGSKGHVAKPAEAKKLGKVVSVDAGAKTFVVTGLSGTNTTVTTNASTTFVVNGHATGSIADVQANSIVKVQGTSTTSGTFIATKVVIGWKRLASMMKHWF